MCPINFSFSSIKDWIASVIWISPPLPTFCLDIFLNIALGKIYLPITALLDGAFFTEGFSTTDLTMGALVACVILSGRTLSPLVQLSGILNRFNSANAACEKINNLMEEESNDENLPENAAVTVKEGKIESAKKNLYKALEQSNSPDTDVTINMALGNMNQQMGNFDKAKNNFEIVSKIDQSNTAADKSISTMHKYLNDTDPHFILMIKNDNNFE